MFTSLVKKSSQLAFFGNFLTNSKKHFHSWLYTMHFCSLENSYRGSSTSSVSTSMNSTSTIFSAIGIKLVLVEFLALPTLLYKMPSNLKGKNFVSKFPGYCPQNKMVFFSSKLDGIKKYFCRQYLQNLNALIF